MQNLAPVLALALLGMIALGHDLGDAKLGNHREPYTPTPMCVQPDNVTYIPCKQ